MPAPMEAREPLSDLAAYARKIAGELALSGPMIVKGKRDLPGGKIHVVSVGMVFWPNLALGVAAGIDFPVLALREALKEAPASAPAPRYGVRSRWLFGDLEHLLWYLVKGPSSMKIREGAPSRIEVVSRFFRDFNDPATRWEVQSRDDPEPYRVIRKRLAVDTLRVALRGLRDVFGLAQNRYPGLIAVVDGGDPETTVAEIREKALGRKLRFVCLAWNATGQSREALARFVDRCARESSEGGHAHSGLRLRLAGAEENTRPGEPRAAGDEQRLHLGARHSRARWAVGMGAAGRRGDRAGRRACRRTQRDRDLESQPRRIVRAVADSGGRLYPRARTHAVSGGVSGHAVE
ncbi:MAG: ATP-grasp domain-containing protein [Deltaproteobacteria bacterium]|nr:ATP-grasp domain-containing protein [Deltaproteobacteria bacterium]